MTLKRLAGRALRWASSVYSFTRRPLTRFRLSAYDRLNLGAGGDYRDGWANLDIGGRRNLIWDLTKPLPLKISSIRYVYSEHFIEHVSREDAVKLLSNARACMKSDGVIRLSTPDLRLFSEAYLAGDVPPLWSERNPTRMFNELMRNWGHIFLYDEPELRAVLTEAGFTEIKRVARHQSDHPELCRLEQRVSQLDLIMEAKP